MMPNWFSHHPTGHPSRPVALQDEQQEMVLLTVARAEENGRRISTDDLVRELDLPRPTLTILIAPLLEQSLLQSLPDGTLSLTETGRSRALALLRRHRLTERLFTDVLGLDWAQAHEEADRIEHALSPTAERQLASQLGEPDTCPHGNPIPSANGDWGHTPLSLLADCTPSTRATIARIGLETPSALRHLATLGLLPDVEIEIENKAPLGGPLMVRVGRAHYALGRDLAARIWVRPSS